MKSCLYIKKAVSQAFDLDECEAVYKEASIPLESAEVWAKKCFVRGNRVVKMTDDWLSRLKPSSYSIETYSDMDIPSLVVEVSGIRRKAFYVFLRDHFGQYSKKAIGLSPDITIDQARFFAKAALLLNDELTVEARIVMDIFERNHAFLTKCNLFDVVAIRDMQNLLYPF